MLVQLDTRAIQVTLGTHEHLVLLRQLLDQHDIHDTHEHLEQLLLLLVQLDIRGTLVTHDLLVLLHGEHLYPRVLVLVLL